MGSARSWVLRSGVVLLLLLSAVSVSHAEVCAYASVSGPSSCAEHEPLVGTGATNAEAQVDLVAALNAFLGGSGGECGEASFTTITIGSVDFFCRDGTPSHTTFTVFFEGEEEEEPEECPAAGTIFRSGLFGSGTNFNTPVRPTCEGGCLVDFSGFMEGRALVNGVYNYFWRGIYYYTGPVNTCTSGASTPTTVPFPEHTCGPGTRMGNVNGQPVCFTDDTADPVNPNNGVPLNQPGTQTTTLPNGNTATTVTNPDGTQTTTERDPEGNVVGEPVTTGGDPMADFCRTNPSSPQCRSSSFGGNCASGFTCEGDAAACAAARASNEVACKFADDPTKNTAGLLSQTGLTGAASDFEKGKSSQDVSSILKFNERSLPAAGCPAPYSVTVLGTSLEFSWQVFCDLAGVVGLFVMLGAMIGAALIVVKGV